MRKKKNAILTAGGVILALAMTGCFALSIHPLFFEKDLVFNPDLVGIWHPKEKEGESTETWNFQPSGDKAYCVTIKGEDGDESVFEAHMLILDKHLFLDFYPEQPAGVNEYYLNHVIPAHSFMRISLEGNVLRMALLDYDWLKKNIQEKKIEIKHETRDDTVILTASTGELQAFVLKHLDAAFDFGEEALYRK